MRIEPALGGMVTPPFPLFFLFFFHPAVSSFQAAFFIKGGVESTKAVFLDWYSPIFHAEATSDVTTRVGGEGNDSVRCWTLSGERTFESSVPAFMGLFSLCQCQWKS
jgi:hypothetical protein